MGSSAVKPPKPLWEVERDAITAALRYCRGDVCDASRCLQVAMSTLYRKIASYDIPLRELRLRGEIEALREQLGQPKARSAGAAG